MKTGALLLATLTVALGCGGRLPADDIIINPGETLSLDDDLVLSGDDLLVINGTPENPCKLDGKHHAIYTDGWGGAILIQNCRIKRLGTQSSKSQPGAPAFRLEVFGGGDVTITNSTFAQCNQFLVRNRDSSTVTLQGNTWLRDGTYHIDHDAYYSQDCLTADGNSTGPKFFQGNTVLKGAVVFNSPNWLIGGDTDAEGNLIRGFRAALQSGHGSNVAKHNYIHADITIDPVHHPYWSQVTTVVGPFREFSYNVVNTARWMLRFISGEVHHNLLVNLAGESFVQIGDATIHDNIFAHYYKAPGVISYPAASFIYAYQPTDNFEVYNNVFDARGDQDETAIVIAGLTVGAQGFISSLRNNVFYGLGVGDYIVGPLLGESWGSPVLGYADYNLFHAFRDGVANYAVTVPGLAVRQDPGFGFFDVWAGDGVVDEKADPMFQGPLPDAFYFNDYEDDIVARRVTVSDILSYYWTIYTPAEGSPLIGAGDPQDGPGTNIGIR